MREKWCSTLRNMRLVYKQNTQWRRFSMDSQSCLTLDSFHAIIHKKWLHFPVYVDFAGEYIPVKCEASLLIVCQLAVAYINAAIRSNITTSDYEAYEEDDEESGAFKDEISTGSERDEDEPFSDPEQEFFRGLMNEDLDFTPCFGKARVHDDEIF